MEFDKKMSKKMNKKIRLILWCCTVIFPIILLIGVLCYDK
jgi:ABC-type uncharacterized transport system involved in gliding motility auxiliary subunit